MDSLFLVFLNRCKETFSRTVVKKKHETDCTTGATLWSRSGVTRGVEQILLQEATVHSSSSFVGPFGAEIVSSVFVFTQHVRSGFF
jgi:hypothetical protein